MNNFKVVRLYNKAEIEQFLRQNSFLHLYSIGDLDNFFWEHTTYYALKQHAQIKQIALLYTGSPLPVILGFTEKQTKLMAKLLQSIKLPKQFYAHLSANLVEVFADNYQIKSPGLHYKMGLTNPALLDNFNPDKVSQLTIGNVRELEELYRVSYPGNWFEPRMLETGYYYGIRHGKKLVSVAGVHVYSEHYQVAALGNVTTHPLFRGQGLGACVCAKLCKQLLKKVVHLGLNVKADNLNAIRCYQKLGFEYIATFAEYALDGKIDKSR